jgi:RNA polymerase sigma factor (sigma-70 family)
LTPHALISPARLAGAPLLRAQSDERLVDLVRAGNDAAFEAIVGRYRRPLLRYCSGFMSEARAEDAVQTALVSAYDALRASRGEMYLRPWLYRIAHNAALNALRDRGLHHEELAEETDGVERPDQAFERGERLRDVLAAVSALPDRQRDAMVLRELEGRSYEEIATELGVSGGSVRQLLNRGRNTLRAGMTAVTPVGLLGRVPWGGAPEEAVATRVAELCSAGAGAAVLTKVCATAIVTGAVVGGVAGAPSGGLEDGKAGPDGRERSARTAQASGQRAARVEEPERGDRGPERGKGAAGVGGGDRDDRDPGEDRRGRGGTGSDDADRGSRDDRSGPGGDDDSSGPGPGPAPEPDDDTSDRSGPGGGGSDDFVPEVEEITDDSSGPGSGTTESDTSGSGTSGSGSSGSGTSGSGSSGSGSSGSDSSGSGSGSSADELEPPDGD